MIECNNVTEAGYHYERREIEEALSCLLRAVESGEDPLIHSGDRWRCWMLLGEFERAWKESDLTGTSVRGTLPVGHGRVLVRCLRGLGDAIQFLRYARELRQHCDHLTVHGPARLIPLCSLIPGVDEAISFDTSMDGSGYDFELECSDLPYLFRATPATIPYADGYLNLAGPRRLRASEGDSRLKVGLVWTAGSWNPSRSIPASLLEPLTKVPGVALFSLQRDADHRQLATRGYGTSIIETEQEGGDILDTLAVISNLDLMISVDTMVAHLAGAAGIPVWTLLTYAADWRWMLDRSDTPWYASMRLIRQSTPGDWISVIDRVAKQLGSY